VISALNYFHQRRTIFVSAFYKTEESKENARFSLSNGPVGIHLQNFADANIEGGELVYTKYFGKLVSRSIIPFINLK